MLYENNSNCKQMIELLGLVKSEDEIAESIIIIQRIMRLIDETGIDLEQIKSKYELDSLNDATIPQLEEIENNLIRYKKTVEKVKLSERID